LIEEGGLTQEAMAKRVGKNRVTVTNSLRLLDLPTVIQSMLTDGRLSAAHGKALLGLQGHPFQERMAKRAATEEWSVRDTEDHVRRYKDLSVLPVVRGARTRAETPPEVLEAQRRLADHLQTRVKVEMGKRKGKIILDFVSLEDLDRLLSAIEGEHPRATHIVIPE
jgi:ParB family chromosome partitioning protein